MKIKVPKEIDTTDMTQRELVFLCLLTYFTREHGFEYYFNFNSYDVKYILNFKYADSRHQDWPLKKYLQIVKWDASNLLVKLNPEMLYVGRVSKVGKFVTKTIELTDLSAIGIMWYLMGRLNENTVNEEGEWHDDDRATISSNRFFHDMLGRVEHSSFKEMAEFEKTKVDI